jgi:uncharacterized membrane protein
MSSTLSVPAFRLNLSAAGAMRAAAGFWFTVAFVGQVIFASSTALFYSMTALRGDFVVWNKHLAHGYTAGDPVGNAALIIHIVAAVFVIFSGAIQFVPAIRRRAPVLHRWNGRVYIFTAFSIAVAGLYLLISRGTGTSRLQEFGTGVLGVLVVLCAAMALRTALKRDFATHRRWAWRLYLLVSSALFIRSSIALAAMIAAGTGTFDLSALKGSVLTFVTFGQYIIPLAVLELYFWTQLRGGRAASLAMAAGLVAISLTMCAGVAAASIGIFVPSIRTAFDPRPSISAALAETIKTGGVDAALAQYRALRSVGKPVYNFDEDELNTLGYQLIRDKNYKGAIRILSLNAEVYPKSGNTWDSLGEAYMDDGDIADAVANYHKSLSINPGNQNAREMLAKMGAR